MNVVVKNFDNAARGYDHVADVQNRVAEELVTLASSSVQSVQSVLDIGCGTGLVTEKASKKWPEAEITALDQSPAMIGEARQKVARLKGLVADAAMMPLSGHYDLVLSSMMLHWLDRPDDIIREWQRFVKPKGLLAVALLVDGSFYEWGDLCKQHGVLDGLWSMPQSTFADGIGIRKQKQALKVSYASAHAFLNRLKATGAATPRVDYQPMTPQAMRALLRYAPQPFVVTYEVLYILIHSV